MSGAEVFQSVTKDLVAAVDSNALHNALTETKSMAGATLHAESFEQPVLGDSIIVTVSTVGPLLLVASTLPTHSIIKKPRMYEPFHYSLLQSHPSLTDHADLGAVTNPFASTDLQYRSYQNGRC